MRILFLLLVIIAVKITVGFVVPTSFVVTSTSTRDCLGKQQQKQFCPSSSSLVLQHAVDDNEDEYVDFLSDFNPSEFDAANEHHEDGDDVFDQDYGGRNDHFNDEEDEYQQPRQQKRQRRFRQRVDPGRQYENEGSNVLDYSYDYSNESEGRMRAKLQRKVMSKYGHDYIRANVDDTPFENPEQDLEHVHDLLALRLNLRLEQKFDESDCIRRQLLQDYGVRVFDTERVWRTGCNPETGEGMDWYPGRLRHAEKKKLAAQMRLSSDDIHEDKLRRYGRHSSHNYKRHPYSTENTSDLEEDEIHELLAERMEYRKEKNFEEADAILKRLNEAGVYVQDKIKEWRADGKTFHRPTIHIMPDALSLPFVDPALVNEIQTMVDARQKAWRKRDYEEVTEYQLRLSEEYGVAVDEQQLVWKYGPRLSSANDDSPYTRCPFDDASIDDNVALDVDHLQDLLHSRSLARQQGNFAIADRLLQEVTSFGIDVHDGLRQWRVATPCESTKCYSNKKEKNDPSVSSESYSKGWTRKESDDAELPVDDEVKIRNLLRIRSEARDARMRTKARQIGNTLQSKFGVLIDDKHMEWWISKTVVAAQDTEEQEEALMMEQFSKFDMVGTDDKANLDDLSDDLGSLDLNEEENEEEDDDDDDMDDTTILSVDELAQTDDNEELSSLTVFELKERLRVAGLKVTGNKADLVKRLSQTTTTTTS